MPRVPLPLMLPMLTVIAGLPLPATAVIWPVTEPEVSRLKSPTSTWVTGSRNTTMNWAVPLASTSSSVTRLMETSPGASRSTW